jgi:predicted SAM-dependent methyltransferase
VSPISYCPFASEPSTWADAKMSVDSPAKTLPHLDTRGQPVQVDLCSQRKPPPLSCHGTEICVDSEPGGEREGLSHNPSLEPHINHLFGVYQPNRILDVACGRCEWSRLRPQADWTAIDLFLPYLRECIRNDVRGLERVRGTATVLPFRSRSFDLVLCAEILEHLPPLDGFRMLQEAKRVSKHAVIVTTPADPLGRHAQEVLNDNPLERHITATTQKELGECGFEVRIIKTNDSKWDEFLLGTWELDWWRRFTSRATSKT